MIMKFTHITIKIYIHLHLICTLILANISADFNQTLGWVNAVDRTIGVIGNAFFPVIILYAVLFCLPPPLKNPGLNLFYIIVW